MYCGERLLTHSEPDHKVAITLRCRSWCCPDCAPQRQRQLIAKAISGHPNRFITLTSKRTAGAKPEHAAKRLVEAWRAVIKAAKRVNPRTQPQYLAVFEATASGWPHLHILYRGPWISQKWLSKRMAKLNDSPVCWIEKVGSKSRCAKYVAKYTAKGPGRFGTLKRYWTSGSYEMRKHEKPASTHTWERQKMQLSQWANMWQDFGYTVTWLSQWKAQAVRNDLLTIQEGQPP